MKLFQYSAPVWRAVVRLSACLAALLAMVLKAGATELPIYGGPGGEAGFQIVCPAGSFVTGFQGRAGEWVDTLTVLCTRLDKKTWKWAGIASPEAMPSTSLLSAGSSPGGTPNSASCRREYVVTGANSWHLRAAQAGLLDRLQFRCNYVPESRQEYQEFQFPPSLQAGDAIDRSYPYSGWNVCPAGEAVTGIQGYSGLFVDAIGLICGPLGDSPKEREEQLRRMGEASISPFGPALPTSMQGNAAKDK